MSPIVLGLVGGIASGKSTIARLFQAERPVLHLDADSVARRVSARASVQAALARRFPGAVGPNGKMNREKLARAAFADPAERAALEEITHPPIRRALVRAIGSARQPWVLLDAALLQETGADSLCDAVIYVACPARERRRRAIRDRGWTAEDHARREAAQWSCVKKRARADYVVTNRGTTAEARREVRRVLRRIERDLRERNTRR